MQETLILASASPRRAELLTAAGYAFTVQSADVDESELPGETPEAYVLRVARAKARTIAARRRESGGVVLAADTTVVAGGGILAKPAEEADAIRILKTLYGVVHEGLTGVVVIDGDRELAGLALSRVKLFSPALEE